MAIASSLHRSVVKGASRCYVLLIVLLLALSALPAKYQSASKLTRIAATGIAKTSSPGAVGERIGKSPISASCE
jgi:hypothetical protein